MKYTVGMVHLYSKRPELILQDIFSAFIIFNFAQAAAWDGDTARGASQYKRRVNFSDAVYLCRQTSRGWFLDVLPFLSRKLQPFRHPAAIHAPSLPVTASLPAMSLLDDPTPLFALLFGNLWLT